MTATEQDVQTYELAQLGELAEFHPGVAERALAMGLLRPDREDGSWSAAAAAAVAERKEQIVKELVEARAYGARRCAGHLAELLGAEVQGEDITALAEQGLITACDEYKGHPLYWVLQVEALAGRPEAVALIAERRAWRQASMDTYDAADRLNWRRDYLAADAKACGVLPGAEGRYAIADVERLAADPAFQGRRLLGPDQAATHFEVRRTDLDYAIAAGWLAPARYIWVDVTRRRQVQVPLYRVADVDALADLPGVDWREVRETAPGRPSPLRAWVRKPPSRAQIIRRMAADLGARFRVEVWAYYEARTERWEIDWETVDGAPTREQVAAAIADDPVSRQYRSQLTLATDAGAAIRWARAMLEPDTAVILDTETTDLFGAVVEIAVVDASTGRILLDTLVNPGPDQPIQPGAQAVHGITAADLTNAPTWDKVLPKLKRVTKDRTILAYNAEYDEGVIIADTVRAGRRLGHLGDPGRWGCVMLRRSDWQRVHYRLPLGAGHRARGDALAARDVLLTMTAPR